MATVRKTRWLRVGCLCVFISTFALSQTQTTGRIAGTVRDTQGAAVINAAVSVENSATGGRRTTAADGSGNYGVTSLPPGTYELNISAPGFAIAHFSGLRVGTNHTTTANVVLSVARASIEVT